MIRMRGLYGRTDCDLPVKQLNHDCINQTYLLHRYESVTIAISTAYSLCSCRFELVLIAEAWK